MATAKLLSVRDAVVSAINTAALSSTTATRGWVATDTDDLQIKAIASDETADILDKETTEETYVISVMVRKKVDVLDDDQSDELCSLVVAIMQLFHLEQQFDSLDGPVVLIERRPFPLCSPTQLGDNGFFYGVALLLFRDWAPASGGGGNANTQVVTPVGAGRYEADDSVQTFPIAVNSGLLVVTVTTLTDIAAGVMAVSYGGGMTMDKSKTEDSDTHRLSVYVFSRAVSQGAGNLVLTPSVGQTHSLIAFSAQVIEDIEDAVADVSAANSGNPTLPASLSTGSSGSETTYTQDIVIAAFGVHSDQQPVRWTWGAQMTTVAQDQRSYVASKITSHTTGARALNTPQTVQGVLNPVSGILNAIYAGVVVAYAGTNSGSAGGGSGGGAAAPVVTPDTTPIDILI